MMTVPPRLPIEYVVPLRWSADTDLPEFTCYLRSLRGWVDGTYDDFAQPARLLWEASWLPALAVTALRRPTALPLLLLLPMLVAELGRRRHRGRETFPPSSALWAPLWTLERAITVWIAVGQRATGGARYRGQRIPLAASRPAPPPASQPMPENSKSISAAR